MTLASREYNEKRNFIRMKVETPVEVIVEQNDQTIRGVCRDLSGGGMLIELDNPLAIGTTLSITIASAHGHTPILKAKATVCRVETESAGVNVMGLEIDEVLN